MGWEMEIRKVLVALDGSERSERSLPWARLLARDRAPLLIRVVSPPYGFDPYATNEFKDLQEQAEEYLSRVALQFPKAPGWMVRVGSPAPTILDVAEKMGADLIAITTHGGGRVVRRLFGGTAEKLIRASSIPLLVVPSYAAALQKPRVRRILVPLDGSETSEAILPLAREVAHWSNADLVLTHVRSDTEEENCKWAEVEGHFRAVAEKTQDEWVSVKVVLPKGDIVGQVLRVLRAEKVDMIVMSAHGYGAMKRMLFGSWASKILRESPVPVIVARREALAKMSAPARTPSAVRG